MIIRFVRLVLTLLVGLVTQANADPAQNERIAVAAQTA
jgi:hypothetical protein